jgi:hypothetical protein
MADASPAPYQRPGPVENPAAARRSNNGGPVAARIYDPGHTADLQSRLKQMALFGPSLEAAAAAVALVDRGGSGQSPTSPRTIGYHLLPAWAF